MQKLRYKIQSDNSTSFIFHGILEKQYLVEEVTLDTNELTLIVRYLSLEDFGKLRQNNHLDDAALSILDSALIELLSNKNIFLLIVNFWEDLFLDSVFIRLHRYFVQNGVSPTKIVVSSPNLFQGNDNVLGMNLFRIDWAYYVSKFHAQENHPEYNPTPEKHFTFLNRNLTYDRLVNYLFLTTQGYEDYGNISFLIKLIETDEPVACRKVHIGDNWLDIVGHINYSEISAKLNLLGIDVGRKEFSRAIAQTPVELDNSIYEIEWQHSEDLKKEISSSLFFISHETNCETKDQLFITEKTYKAIEHGKPFLLFGPPGLLAHLNSMGLNTFDQWIDTSYDLEHDYEIRLKKYLEQVEILCKIDNSDLESLQKALQPVAEDNFHVLRNGNRHYLKRELDELVTRLKN